MCAAGAIAPTEVKSKASISRTFGQRKVDEYVADNEFWSNAVTGVNLRAGSREAAMVSERSANAFPSAYMDVVEAGRCLALNRNSPPYTI
jgi:hypothetical protein